MSVTCGQTVMAAKLGFNLVWLGCLFCPGLLGILIHQFCRRKSAIRVIWFEDACLHVRTRCSAGPCRVDWTMRQKKTGQVRLTAGQSAYYVIRQNIRVETWRHWFPRHACTVLYTSPGCGAEHNVLNLPHTQLRSRFFSCWFLRPIRSGELYRVGRACSRGRATFPLLLSKPRPRPPNMVWCLWRAACPLRVFLECRYASEGPSVHQFTSDAVDKQTTAADGDCQLPFYVTEQPRGGASSLVYCTVEQRVLGNVVLDRSTDRLIFGPVHTSSPI